ncbi:MAG: DUF1549 domain-containing protein [Saprospiraceae bacterium]|nr:DUF1549 domain-containing protein [Saprospiraceae bacterium]
MFLLSSHWLLELGGKLHPLLVHFPIGLLVGAWLLESWKHWRQGSQDYRQMVYLGAFFAVCSVIGGALLKASGDYAGETIRWHEISGYLTAGLAILTALYYKYRSDQFPGRAYLLLSISCISLTFAGHWGASLTHGADYLSSIWTSTDQQDQVNLAHWQSLSSADSFPEDQLNRLNVEVRALFAHRCYQCHSEAKRKGGLALDHKEGVFAGGDGGAILVAGAPEESEIIRRLKLPRSDEEAMPTKGKLLSEGEIDLIALWIEQGAPWADTTLKVFREAPLALKRPALPNTPAEIKHPIDKFVHVYFQEQGIEWPNLIDDRQFIRRAFLDITGLLPKPAAIKQFEENPSTNKRQELIKHLLSDKENYTLHWLSFWNDLLRNDYSGTGFITGGRKQVTDWLYRTLIEDKPYNQMAKELINPSKESAGFIKGIQWRGVVNASQRTELQAAQNISQSLLGINLKCASCHNSFINNLTLEQAYSFANIFAEEPLEIHRCDKPIGKFTAPGFLYPSLGEVVGDSLKERLASLAEVVVQPANGRLYRNIVNRFWQQLFGRGIITPVDELDNLPWSQDLLDWMAAEFIQNDYSLAQLLADIMSSQTYQLPAVNYSSPAFVASEEFVFRGPLIKRLSAEQFVDAFAQVVQPFYHSRSYDPDSLEMDCEWIWHEEIEVERRVLPKPGIRRFRKSFSLPIGQQISKAQLLMTADDAYSLFINGQKLLEGEDWQQVQQLDLPIDILRKNNQIAIEGTNEGIIANPAGLLFSLRMELESGDTLFVHSDRSWKTTKDTSDLDWTALTYDDSDWGGAWRAGRFEKSFWGVLPSFNFESTDTALFVRAALVKQDDFMKTLGRPVRENVTSQRSTTSTLLQSLLLTNSALFHDKIKEAAQAWLAAGQPPMEAVEELYVQALGRQPNPREKRILRKQLKSAEPEEFLEDVIWSLVLLPEFQLI